MSQVSRTSLHGGSPCGAVVGWTEVGGRGQAAGWLPRAASGRSGAGRRRRGSAGASAIVCGARPGAVEHAQELRAPPRRPGRRTGARRSPSIGGLADVRLVADQVEDALASAVDAERDDVAGDLALELVGGALGHDLAVVDDRQPVAQRVGLLEVVGRQEDGRAVASRSSRISSHIRARACGSRPVVGSSRKSTAGRWTMPEADVEPAAHAARVGADRAVGGRLEVERGEDLARPPLGVGPVHAVQPALDDELAPARLRRIGRAALRARSRCARGRAPARGAGRRRRRSPRRPSAAAASRASAGSSSCRRRWGRGSRRSRRPRPSGRRPGRPRPCRPRVLKDRRRSWVSIIVRPIGVGTLMWYSSCWVAVCWVGGPCAPPQHRSLSAQRRYLPIQEHLSRWIENCGPTGSSRPSAGSTSRARSSARTSPSGSACPSPTWTRSSAWPSTAPPRPATCPSSWASRPGPSPGSSTGSSRPATSAARSIPPTGAGSSSRSCPTRRPGWRPSPIGSPRRPRPSSRATREDQLDAIADFLARMTEVTRTESTALRDSPEAPLDTGPAEHCRARWAA